MKEQPIGSASMGATCISVTGEAGTARKVIIFDLFENDSTLRAMSRLSTPKDLQETVPVTLVKVND